MSSTTTNPTPPSAGAPAAGGRTSARAARIRPRPDALRALAAFAASLTVVVLAWEVSSAAFGLAFLFPGPLAVAESFVDNLLDGTLAGAVAASLGRILAGFLAGSLLGILLGLLTGASRVFRGLVSPFVTFFRFVPPIAWFGPALVWFGAGETSKLVLIMYTSVFVVALNTLEGGARVPVDMQRMAVASGVTWWQRMLWVTLPASVPSIFAGMRIAMGNAFMTVVTAEMLGASEGLGVMVNTGMISTTIENVFVAIVMLGVLGLIFDRFFVLLMNTVGKRYREQAGQAVA